MRMDAPVSLVNMLLEHHIAKDVSSLHYRSARIIGRAFKAEHYRIMLMNLPKLPTGRAKTSEHSSKL